MQLPHISRLYLTLRDVNMATMLHLIPSWLPQFDDLVADIGRPHPVSLAQKLDISERTIYRYMSQPDSVPRPVLLSLYWLSRWGLSSLDAELHNRAQVHYGLSQALKRENAALRAAFDSPVQAPETDSDLSHENVIFPARFHG